MGADRSPFVGRAAEIAGLAGRIAEARDGSGGLVLVSGPAGIGKTRLVEEAAAPVPGVLWGRSVDDPGAPPLWPWQRVLGARPRVAAAVAAAWDRVDLAHDRADLEAARFRVAEAATTALVEEAEPGGLLVVLEDLHWADEASLRLLRHLAPDLHRSRLLVVCTHRDTGDRLDGTLPELLRWPGTQPLPLGPLTEDDVRTYLAASTPGPVAPDVVRSLHRRSGGNPLHLRVAAGGDRDTTEVRALVRSTMAALDPATVELLSVAAVLGEEVDADLLAEVAARPVADVRAALDTAVRVGVLTTVPDAPGRRRFLHAVVRDGVYADLAPSAREELHRRAAGAWVATVGDDDAAAGVVAGHWLRAPADRTALRSAASWARRAAVAATSSLAFDEAAHFLDTALDAATRSGAADAERAGLLLELATAEYRASRFAEGLRHATEASGTAARCGRADLVAAAALVVHDVSSPDVLPGLVALCERALAQPEVDRSPALRSRLLAQLASVLADSGQAAVADEPSATALALAESCGDPGAVIDAVRARLKARPGALPVPERLRLGRLAVQHAAATGQPLAALWGHKGRIDALLELGDLAAVEAELAAVTTLADATRLPLVRWHDLRLRASVAALPGRFADALALNEQARELARTALAQDRSAMDMSDAFLLQHAQVTGVGPDIGTDDGSLLDRGPEVPVVIVTRALLALLLGSREEAAPLYEVLRTRIGAPDFLASPGVALNVVPLVEEFADAGAAQVLVDHLVGVPADVVGAGVYCTGSSAALLGRLAMVLGRHEEAVAQFERALLVDVRTGARPAATLDRIGLAGALLARRGPADLTSAADLLRRALGECRRLGLPGPLRRVEDLLGQVRAAARTADPLTAREREIASLVAAALTNRQIAERLVLSERTVESHVRSILAKLGAANRTEIAARTLSGG